MCTPECVCCKIADLALGQLFESAQRHFVYLRNYKDNLQNLRVKLNDLETRRGEIQGQVNEAKVRGEIIVDDVTRWLNEVDVKKRSEEEFLNNETSKENIQCFNFSCPNFIERYKLSRQAKKKINNVEMFLNSGNFPRVSDTKPVSLDVKFPQIPSNYTRFSSRELVSQKIREALKDPNHKIIGVVGQGGVGKTTMVQVVGKEFIEDGTFDEVVTAVISREVNVNRIQQQIADMLSPRLEFKTDCEQERASKLWDRLNNGWKNLIILDVIWEDLDLKTIGIPVLVGNSGCKIILTSRNKVVCTLMEADEEVQVEELSEDEAWELFKKQVGEYDVELDPLARELCRKCGALLIAINAVGAVLKVTKEIAVWENALDKLDSILGDKVYTRLKWSYDSLPSNSNKDAQSIFLLCCFFPEDAEIPIEDLMRHCVARRLLTPNPDTLHKARNAVCAAVHQLKTRCLLLDGYSECSVKVHDVIREVGIVIARVEQEMTFLVSDALRKWPVKEWQGFSAINLRMISLDEVPNDFECPKLHTLLLHSEYDFFDTGSERFVQGMKELAVLKLTQLMFRKLPSSFANLVKLRLLSLAMCYLEDFSRFKHLKSLEMLSLQYCIEVESLPLEIGELTSLRLLDLRYCDTLKLIPEGIISKLTSLEELYIWGNGGYKMSLGELRALKRLTTLEIQIRNDVPWPTDLCFDNLSHFKISVVKSCSSSYHTSGNVIHLEDIHIKALGLDILFDGVDSLFLSRVKDLKELLDGRKGFLKLSYLAIRDCEDIEHLVGKRKKNSLTPSDRQNPSTGPFSKLRELVIVNSSFKYLFPASCAVGLQQLQQLYIEDCKMMEEVIVGSTEGEKEPTTNPIKFSQLKSINLSGLPKLKSFYPKMEETTTQYLFNEKVAFPALRELIIQNIPNITEIWDEQLFTVPRKEAGSFSQSQLEEISVDYCEKLVNVFPSCMIRWSQNVKKLSVKYCANMEVIVVLRISNDDIIEFPQLTTLTLEGLNDLKSFLSSSKGSGIQTLFNQRDAFPNLEKLSLMNCKNLSPSQFWPSQVILANKKKY